MCWSPKGKQLLVGRSSGAFTQYDPKLTAKKSVAAPTNLFNGAPVSGAVPAPRCILRSASHVLTFAVLDVFWESTFVYIAAFAAQQPSSDNNSDQPTLVCVTCAKNQPPVYTNFDDVCYGASSDRRQAYFMRCVPEW